MLEYGRKKLAAKGCDVLVVNDVSGGEVFDRHDNEVILLDRFGGQRQYPRSDKSVVADHILDAVADYRERD